MKPIDKNQRQSKDSSFTLGLVMDFFNPKLLEGARAYCEEQHIRLDARWSVRGDWLPEKLSWNGVLHGLVEASAVSERLAQTTLPALALTADESSLAVIPDYYRCGQLAAEELLCYGAEHLLLAKLSHRFLDRRFFDGALSVAQQHQIPFTAFDNTSRSFRPMIRKLVRTIKKPPSPLGFCLAHAAVAHSVTNALASSGIRIPEEVSIVVIDKDVQQTAALATVPLTSIELNEWHRGFVAAETLHRWLLDKHKPAHDIQIPPRGVRGRASTGHVESRDPVMAKALGYLRAHFKQSIGVPEIVAAAGASRRLVEMRFREALNRSIHEELRRLRIEHAQHLLKEQSLSITEIARSCGFASVHYFSAAFKREIGISPKRFQQQNRDASSRGE
ncbi:helix-turn-helix domain-containing protein [Verrucomicrobiaceae bacterium N1E253]|uniref:Helix-turn-helix domain-containing protein n=1 Tax=Oceaniferula marina TaxID=2748318 RepID=A0A851GK98_9BACT|nr:helix-turn-helix domain-containing protein [Oceaniferula marina]NWK57442.1 helix-turn-helix domain-containing protein [Oceaniferula marina]